MYEPSQRRARPEPITHTEKVMISLTGLDCASFLVLRATRDMPRHILAACVVLGPSIGLLDTLRKIIATGSCLFYNSEVGAIQIITNILRFIYWRHRPVRKFLLWQSITFFSMHMFLSVLAANSPRGLKPRRFISLVGAQSISEYIIAIVTVFSSIVAVFASLRLIFGEAVALTATVVVANGMDVVSSMPHVLQVVWRGDSGHISGVVVAQYLLGDVMKLAIYVIGATGWVFIAGAVIQTCMDSVLLVSFVRQRRNVMLTG